MKPIFQEVCSIPQELLAPIIEKYSPLNWTDSKYNVANPIFKNVSGQVVVIMAESVVKVDDPDIKALLEQVFPWWAVLGPSSNQIFRVMVANLQAGRTLDWHIDGFEFHFQCWRYHIPLVSNEQCILEVRTPDEGVQSFSMNVGSMYTFNNNIDHRTYNHGSDDRINIIIDVKPADVDLTIKDLVTHRFLK